MAAILGISAYYHDSAAALLVDGQLIAAAQEERFTRLKHDANYPRHAIEYVLSAANISINQIDYIVFYDKPFLKFERLLETYLAYAPSGFKSFRLAMPIWMREKLFQKDLLTKQLKKYSGWAESTEKLLFSEHHFSHAASAYFPSPFTEAVVLTLDGVGEWATTTVAIGRGSTLHIEKELHFPHSLGLLYSAFTYYTGFRVNSGEYKLMGLAPYGQPRYKAKILESLVDLKEDGSFRLDQSYFSYSTGVTMTNKRFERLFGQPTRQAESALLTQFHMDIAASVQAVTEEIVLRITRSLAEEYNIENLCLAGGVALNCVANGKILRDGSFKNVWVQPAAGDAGGALGAAYAAWHYELQHPLAEKLCHQDCMLGSYLGPEYSSTSIESRLSELGAIYRTVTTEEMLDTAAQAIADGQAIGWFQGRMEFGPRALGARSILADPRSKDMQKNLNLKVKYRESFRPFAPSVLAEYVSDWFEHDSDSPYMSIVAPLKKTRRLEMTAEQQALFGIEKLNTQRSEVPAVTHVDYSARLQTVHKQTNPLFHELITRFYQITDCPMVVNTSFNVRGEPIVCSPEDAFRCFMGTDLDMLVCGNSILLKDQQPGKLREDYRNKYSLD